MSLRMTTDLSIVKSIDNRVPEVKIKKTLNRYRLGVCERKVFFKTLHS